MRERIGGRSEDLKELEQLFGASLPLLCISRFTEYLADRLCISRFTEYLADTERQFKQLLKTQVRLHGSQSIPVPASLFLISSDALGSSGLLFLVARPETISSILSSSKNLLHAYLPGTNLGNRCWHTLRTWIFS